MRANSGDPDQTPRSVASDLGLHCSYMSHKKDVRLIWVKMVHNQYNFSTRCYAPFMKYVDTAPNAFTTSLKLSFSNIMSIKTRFAFY